MNWTKKEQAMKMLEQEKKDKENLREQKKIFKELGIEVAYEKV